MICPTCKNELFKKLKVNELYKCQCGAQLLAVKIKKNIEIYDLDKGENK